ncbi:MAG: formyltetrahydrofolate deformylase [Terriglobales bacterium]|jgi:formyltetrahydrofolate deformylase
MHGSSILLVSCPDRKGVVAAIADFIFRHNGNILCNDEHGDEESNLFLTRVEFDTADFAFDLAQFSERFAPIARDFRMDWRLAHSNDRPRIAIFVSKYDHCLQDLLYRHQSGELPCEIPLIVSNHPDNQRIADFYRVPYYVIPVTKENKVEAEERQIELLREHKCSLVVLARYMQVLSGEFIAAVGSENLINIHHSFLPAFVGSKPYHRAFQRGVKLIGATAHYVTQVLDDGPIIDQDVVRIHHRDTVEDLVQKGRDIEKIVLSRAVRWHVENRILLYGNKTVVFQ